MSQLARIWALALALALISSGPAWAGARDRAEAPERATRSSGALRLEAESLPATVSTGDRRSRRTSADSEVDYSAGAADRLVTDARGDFISYKINVPAPGTYAIRGRALKAVAAGIHQLKIDGAAQGPPQDSYAPANTLSTFNLGQRTFESAGPKTFTFTAVSKAAKSENFNLTTDYLELVPLSTTGRGVKIEGETLTASTSRGDTHETFRYRGLSGGSGDRFNANAVGDFIVYDVRVPAAGTYALALGTRTYRARGIYQLSVNGVDQGQPIDTYAATPTFPELQLGEVRFTSAGTAKIRFTAIGKNRNSKGYGFLVDYLRLTPSPA